ncbi:MAG TPA: extracellular solute-binding protein [Actinomycetota bacterium]|nr:extracellular solute-binding protein [Actinomycetota bacterium]
MRRGIKGLALLAALPLALGACSSGGDSGGSSPSPANPGEVSGTVVFWDTSDSTNEAPTFRQLIKKFEAEYPNVKVDYQNVPFSEAQNKYKTAAQADNAPDVLRAEVAWTPEFASLGYLLPLTGTSLDTPDAYMETPWSSNIYENVLYGVPQVTDAPGLMYNKALLDKAGVQPPTTWDEVQAASEKLKAQGVDTLYSATGGYFTLPYIYSFGGNTVDPAAQKILINSPESVAGFQQALDLIDNGAAVKPDPNDAYNRQMALFKEGKVAMIINGPWAVADTLTGKAFKGNEDNLGVTTTPAGPDGLQGSPVGGHNYVIFAGTQNQSASEAFVAYMNSPASQAFVAAELGLLPTQKAAYDEPDVKDNKIVQEFKPIVESATPRAWIPEGGQFFTAMDEQWINMYTGKATAQEGADAIAKAWKQFLPDYTE